MKQMKVTKEDVDKAKAAADAAYDAAAEYEAAYVLDAAWEAADAAWSKYIKLKEEYEANESGE